MGRRFRNAMVNFKSEEDLEVYLKKFTEEIPKLMPEIKQMTICRASKDSFYTSLLMTLKKNRI